MLFSRYNMYYLFFFKQKTAYEMRISDWSSDVCSSDLDAPIMARRRWRIGNRRECGIGSDRGGRVARHLDFGHDRDVTRGRISAAVADLGLGVEAAIAQRTAIGVDARRSRGLPPRADAGELQV